MSTPICPDRDSIWLLTVVDKTLANCCMIQTAFASLAAVRQYLCDSDRLDKSATMERLGNGFVRHLPGGESIYVSPSVVYSASPYSQEE